MSEASEPFRILVVCTGNICRSPVGELLLRAVFHELAPEASVEVSSAGTHAVVDHPIQRDLAELLRADDVDPDDFRARQLTSAMAVQADLVIVATRAHRELIVRRTPGVLRRTFTIKEFARLALQIEADPPHGVEARLRWLVAKAPLMRGHNPVPAIQDDIPDPYGGTDADYRAAYLSIRDAIVPVARTLLAG